MRGDGCNLLGQSLIKDKQHRKTVSERSQIPKQRGTCRISIHNNVVLQLRRECKGKERITITLQPPAANALKNWKTSLADHNLDEFVISKDRIRGRPDNAAATNSILVVTS